MPLALREAGWYVELHDDHFPQDAKDPELLSAVAARGWVFLTQDARIRYHAAEVRALRAAGLRAIVLATGSLTAEKTAEILEKARSRIERVAAEEDAPFIFRVAKDGSVKRVDRRSDSQH